MGRCLVVQAAACGITFAIDSVVYSAWLHGQPSLKDGSTFVFGEAPRKMMVPYPFNHAVMYALIVLAYHAWLYNRHLRERDRFEPEPLFYGDYAVRLKNGVRLTLTRSHRDCVERLLTRAGGTRSRAQEKKEL